MVVGAVEEPFCVGSDVTVGLSDAVGVTGIFVGATVRVGSCVSVDGTGVAVVTAAALAGFAIAGRIEGQHS